MAVNLQDRPGYAGVIETGLRPPKVNRPLGIAAPVPERATAAQQPPTELPQLFRGHPGPRQGGH